MSMAGATRKGMLAGRRALVTGSGQNIGRAIALAFAREGADVVVNGHTNKTHVDAVVQEIESLGQRGFGIMADVGDATAVEQMVRDAEGRLGAAIDIAVSNVSVRHKQPFLDISIEDWRTVLNSNLNASFYLDRTVLPGMKAGGFGRIIHISGVDGFTGHMQDRAHNIVAKAGVHALSKAIGLEFGQFGVTANTIAPGIIDTERDWSQYPKDIRMLDEESIPVRRLGTVEEIAYACVYLSSPLAGYVNGQVIHLNGGPHMF
jgi:3-oxoacyl-[acyl-carrier protein] reductase